jgi:hypothetical protein
MARLAGSGRGLYRTSFMVFYLLTEVRGWGGGVGWGVAVAGWQWYQSTAGSSAVILVFESVISELN